MMIGIYISTHYGESGNENLHFYLPRRIRIFIILVASMRFIFIYYISPDDSVFAHKRHKPLIFGDRRRLIKFRVCSGTTARMSFVSIHIRRLIIIAYTILLLRLELIDPAPRSDKATVYVRLFYKYTQRFFNSPARQYNRGPLYLLPRFGEPRAPS